MATAGTGTAAPEINPLSQLEERIERAVVLVTRLRQEKEALLADLSAAQTSLEGSQERNAVLTEELEALRVERSQVRARLEKLIGHIDQLGAA